MGTENRNDDIEALSVDQEDPVAVLDPSQEYGLTTAHIVAKDPWWKVGWMLVVDSNSPYILSYSYLMFVPLGRTWGVICLCFFGLYTAYANWLLAGFHVIDGRRFIRYRDLMGFLFGREMFYLTWVFQCWTLLLKHMGFMLIGGRALKEILPWGLPFLIIMIGANSAFYLCLPFLCTLFTKSSGLHQLFTVLTKGCGLRLMSTVLIMLGYILILLQMAKDKSAQSKEWYDTHTKREYSVSGSKEDKAFNAFGAISAIVVCNTSGAWLFDFQSTLRRPAIENMRKALHLQYSLGLMVYNGVSIAGYWTYGSTVSEYLPMELRGPKWVKILINAAVLVQSMVSQIVMVPLQQDLIFARSMPMKCCVFVLELIILAGSVLLTAAFPFMSGFVTLCGSFTLPLTFVFPSMIFIKIKGRRARIETKVWHWTNIAIFSLLTIATTISAVWLIVNNVRAHSFFADIQEQQDMLGARTTDSEEGE